VNRRTRRARRRLRRGDAPEPLLLITDDRTDLIDWAALLGRIGYRYRSELLPLAVAGSFAVTGAILHGHHVEPWSVGLVGLAVGAGLCWPRVAPLLRPVERAYTVAVVLASAGWLAAATHDGPGTAPLPLLLVGGTIVGGVPWWTHRRRRAKVRVERTLAAWPQIIAAIGLPGSRVMSAVVDRWGWRARIGLPPGQTPADLINAVPALESGLHTRPGAVRVEPDPYRADHALVRVLSTDPHAHALPYPTPGEPADRAAAAPIPLGLFEDADPVTVRLSHRHGLLGGVAGAGKSGVLNVILAELVACPDVVLWGVDLKGGMELRPWASCLDRLATTSAEATALLADAVAVLESRAHRLAADGSRLWQPTAATPALIVVIDEYAELAEESAAATGHADSIARRGRAVAVTLLAATQRPTQKAMGSGAVRSQMDVRICLRVRERRDVDLILGQGMLTAGWAADTLNAAGKFLISTPEHTTPRRARAYRLTDHEVATIAARHAPDRPQLDAPSRDAITTSATTGEGDTADERRAMDLDDPAAALWAALLDAAETGRSVRELMTSTGMGRTWVYARLQELAADGRATQISRGRWTVTGKPR
jgi:S-DNA-T family DNA segregation ATPase FtsK/SpoIIIE